MSNNSTMKTLVMCKDNDICFEQSTQNSRIPDCALIECQRKKRHSVLTGSDESQEVVRNKV